MSIPTALQIAQLCGVPKVEAYRFDAEFHTVRRVRISPNRLCTLSEAVQFLRVRHRVATSTRILREAVLVGDLDCHVMITGHVARRHRFTVALERDDILFTLHQLADSDWLDDELFLRTIERDQGVIAAAAMQERLRHPGWQPALSARGVDEQSPPATLQ